MRRSQNYTIHGTAADDDDRHGMQTFEHYALGRSPEQQRRLWAQVGGSAEQWTTDHDDRKSTS